MTASEAVAHALPSLLRDLLTPIAVLTLSLGCSAAEYRSDGGHARLVAPVALGEGHTGKSPVSAASSRAVQSPPKTSESGAAPVEASPSGAASDTEAAVAPAASGTPPDPEPLSTAQQIELLFEYNRGEIRLVSAIPKSSAQQVGTARMMGRYAVELWIGRELVERVRFDFPLLAAEPAPDEPATHLRTPPSLAAGALVQRRVKVPASTRATRAQLVDRATGDVFPLAWPPAAGPLQRAASDRAAAPADAKTTQ